MKCLCDVLGCRAVVCRSVLSRYPKGAVLAAGAKEWLPLPQLLPRVGLWGAWLRQLQEAPCHDAITSFPPQCSCVCRGQQQARALPQPVQILCLSRSAPLRACRCPRAPSLQLCPPWWQQGHGPGCWMWGQSCLFSPLALPVIKDKDLTVPALCSWL